MAWYRNGLALLAALVVAGIGVAVTAPPAEAAKSRACRQLEAELSGVGRSASSARLREYDAAIATQRDQIGLARARGNGALAAKMQRNLQSLLKTRNQIAGGSGGGRSRATILAALEAGGCRATASVRKREPKNPVDLGRQLFGGPIRMRRSLEDGGILTARRPDGSGQPSGSYRTLCVRTCDGYFFPVSNASSQSDFARDQANCEASCPGTEVGLYYRRAGDEATDMTSVATGALYSALPAAGLYRRTDVQSPMGCGCNRPAPAGEAGSNRGFEVVAGEDRPAAPVTGTGGSVVTFGAQASPAETAPQDEAVTALPPPGERRVRVVGPVFLPDQAAAADPQAPDPTDVP